MDMLFLGVAVAFSFLLGAMVGKYVGYTDAKPIRDRRGRFIARKKEPLCTQTYTQK
jgi:hypothetical protein